MKQPERPARSIMRFATRVLVAALAAGTLSAVSMLAPSAARLNRNVGTVYAAACAPSPQVTRINPNVGRDRGGLAVTITGCGFSGATSVTFGSTSAPSFTVDSDSQITTSTPRHVPAGVYDVTVTTPSGTSATSVADRFTYFTSCDDLTQSTAPASPQPVGTQIVITASIPIRTCLHPLFGFWIQYPGSQIWQAVQNYSVNSTYNWDTASLPPGTYSIIIVARDRDSPGVGGGDYLVTWDVFYFYYYTLTAPTVITPCTSVKVSAVPPAPQKVGTKVAFTATAVACPHPRYAFWIVYTGSQTWHLAQAYSPSGSYNLDTSALPGAYRLSVWARDATSPGIARSAFGTWDAFNAFSYVVNDPSACTSVSASVMPPSPQLPGTKVVVTGVATGCPNPRYAFYVFNPNTNQWTLGQSYSRSATFTWNTAGLYGGLYRFSVWAQDAASFGTAADALGSWDAYTTLTYTLT